MMQTRMERWSAFVVRTRWFWIIAWPVLALAVWWPAPKIPTLLHDDATGFLPADMPSEQAFALLRQEFPDRAPASRAAVIFDRTDGLTDADRRVIDDTARALDAQSVKQQWRITAAYTSPAIQSLVESADGRAALIAVDLPAGLLTQSTVNRVRLVQDTVRNAKFDPGLEVHVTGSGALGELLDRSAKKDIDRTTFWTFVGVALVLLLVYRSLISLSVSIVTIAAALLLSIGLIGWAAAGGLPINGLVEMFIVVVLVGAGVDYCLFLLGRFLESSKSGASAVDATKEAVSRTGTAILASAATNVAGLSMLIFGRHRDLNTSGPTIAFSLCVGAFAVLTLAPALMAVFGKRLRSASSQDMSGLESSCHDWNTRTFPDRASQSRDHKQSRDREGADHSSPHPNRDRKGAAPFATSGEPCDSNRPLLSAFLTHRGDWFWPRVARLATQRSGIVVAVILLLMIPLAIMGARIVPLYDSFAEYPADSSFVRGAKIYSERFHQTSDVSELTVVVTSDDQFGQPENHETVYHSLDALASMLVTRFPLIYQRDLADPLGNARVKSEHGGQLRFGGEPRASARAVTNFAANHPNAELVRLASPARADRDKLAQAWSAVTQVVQSVSQAAASTIASDYYVGQSGKTMRIDLGLAIEARSVAAMDLIPQLKNAIHASLQNHPPISFSHNNRVELFLSGETPMYADMRALRERDFRVIGVASLLVIGAILVLLTRSVLQSLILIGVTLLTYLATYGLTWLVFREWTGIESLNWQVNFFLFIIILSLGQDYNIFVVLRIREELRRATDALTISRPSIALDRKGGDTVPAEALPFIDRQQAVARAIVSTGRVVSSCGLVMAATFASMFSGSLLLMKELAVAISLGILIDAFIVRPLLLPGLILSLDRARELVSARSLSREPEADPDSGVLIAKTLPVAEIRPNPERESVAV